MSDKKGILMICLGNICRSPIAEAVVAHQVKQQNLSEKFFIDSAAIGKLYCLKYRFKGDKIKLE